MRKPGSKKTGHHSRKSSKSKLESDNARGRKPTLDAIRALVAFADEGCSVSAAARALHSQQPVVSTKLKSFQSPESMTGAILLERASDGRSLRLSDAGQAALPAMRGLLRSYDQLLEHLREGTESAVLIKLAVGAFGAEHFVPSALALMRKSEDDNSSCLVKTNVVRGRDRIVGIADGVSDLAVVSHSQEQIDQILREAEISQQLEFTPMSSLPLIVAVGKRTADAKLLASTNEKRPVPLNLLEQFELAGPDSSSGVRRQLEQAAGTETRLTFSVEGGGWSAAREFARHGLGVAIIPAICLSRTDSSKFVSRRLDDTIRLRHMLISRKGGLASPELDRLSKALINVALQHAD